MLKRLVISFAVIIYFLSSVGTGLSYSSINFPQSIKTPEQIVKWFQDEFTYEFKFPDYMQTPEETVSRRSGDCEDFALLSRIILNRLGIKSEVIIIRYQSLDIMHAVCIFKQGAAYSVISNREFVRTNGRTINAALTEIFPDWDRIVYLSADGAPARTVERGAALGAAASTLSLPSMYGNLLGPEHRDISMIRLMLGSRLHALTRSGMSFSVATFMTIFRDQQPAGIQFIFDKIQLTPAGFRVPVAVNDKDGKRAYYILFSVRGSREGFSVAVYPESDWKRITQFDAIMPHPVTSSNPM